MTERDYLRHLNKSAQKFFPPRRQAAAGACRNTAPGEAVSQDQGAAHQAAAPLGQLQRGGDLPHALGHDRSARARALGRKHRALAPEARAKLNVSVVAHGGYGRRVMSPGSDVDLTFMFPGNSEQGLLMKSPS
jgi:hypothetical protein